MTATMTHCTTTPARRRHPHRLLSDGLGAISRCLGFGGRAVCAIGRCLSLRRCR
jgi:hypothetical protein